MGKASVPWVLALAQRVFCFDRMVCFVKSAGPLRNLVVIILLLCSLWAALLCSCAHHTPGGCLITLCISRALSFFIPIFGVKEREK